MWPISSVPVWSSMSRYLAGSPRLERVLHHDEDCTLDATDSLLQQEAWHAGRAPDIVSPSGLPLIN
jgi:hypothetical protein